MTNEPNRPASPKKSPEQPALSFSLEDLAAMRVRPADFAKMMNVSRQTVSQWIKQGKCVLGADGRLDPHQAAKQVIAKSDPTKLRARILRTATEERAELLAQIEDLKEQLRLASDPVGLLAAELDRARIEIQAALVAEGIKVDSAASANVAFCSILVAIDNARNHAGISSDLADRLEHRFGPAAAKSADELEMSDLQLIEMRALELGLEFDL